jgi:beta-lactamase class A
MQKLTCTLALLATLVYGTANAKKHETGNPLEKKIKAVIDTNHAHIGVGVYGIESHDTLLMNDGHRYPMQSTYKVPLAMYVLHLVEQGKLSLDKQYAVNTNILNENTWSPLVKEFPKQTVILSLQEIMGYCVSQSDNNACDILFSLVGGPEPVNDYVHSLGIGEMTIRATEADMTLGWGVQFVNWCEPNAMLQLLRKLYNGSTLNKADNDLLLGMMTDSKNPDRIALGLPKGTKLAHKTGTSAADPYGVYGAINDVGIVTLPDGHHVLLAVFLSEFKGSESRGEELIGKISKCVWDSYTEGKR